MQIAVIGTGRVGLVTALLGFGPGILWAFVAGLTANLLVEDPLGTLPLALLLVMAPQRPRGAAVPPPEPAA